ncbi:hypothetical protein DVK85_10840 [Flavobacterium arcticum]|uniref:T9SS C-terminal target domain-containing protein n=1 Tax=Flavobacterium arcticum TaxID=1784713 RepID=A0A345HDN7_9FLAO|nr:T9SS sorting signal type C domain-containing protein [Flavobacterium arcticum]AXG74697.1 hypothetical protein DVK85_10840 [Flavobacterium arcticum]KAF2509804.1 T9SS sorting signal type C domain-containing protein [Flavobacterium arcticum]
MMKLFQKKLLFKIFTTVLLLFNCILWAQGNETFTNVSIVSTNSSYQTRSWTGDNGISWTATEARRDIYFNTSNSSSTYTSSDGDGNTICINSGGYVENTTTISGGVGTLSFEYARAYSGNSTLKVYVNDVQYGGTITVSSVTPTTFSVDVNVTGDAVIRLENSAKRTIIDNLEWTAGAAPPTVTTTEIITTDITTTSATSGGNVTSTGDTSTERGVVWSTSVNPTVSLSTKTSDGTSTTTGIYSSTITGLNSNTQYYYRAYATNAGGTAYGTEYSFYTRAITPAVPTLGNPFINSFEITLDENGNNSTVEYAIRVNGSQYVDASGELIDNEVWQTATTWGMVTVTNLTANTDYSVDVKARNISELETPFSSAANITTLSASAPFITLDSASLDYGDVCTSISGNGSFTFTGQNIDANSNVTIAALAGYSYSLTEVGTYVDNLTINNYNNETVTVYVKFSPTEVINYDGDIIVSGQGDSESAELSIPATGSGINTAGTAVTGATSSITQVSAIVAGQGITGGCTAISTYGIEYSTTSDFTPGEGIQIEGDNLSESDFTVTIYSLSPETTYYYIAYITDGSGTLYGEQSSFTTLQLDAPITTEATNITSNSFTANWDLEIGAEGYYLEVSEYESFGTGIIATDLFFSEYVEGSSNNKYLEIYNGTGASVDLSDYQIRQYNNGSSSPTYTQPLLGTLNDGETIVINNTSAALYYGSNMINGGPIMAFNGDDTMVLYKLSTNAFIDIIGSIGDDPGSYWDGGGNLRTRDRTIVRNSNILSGVTNTNTTDFPTLATEWTGYSQNYINLGSHTFGGGITPSFVEGYEGLDVGNVTSYEVTGLDPFKTYYYRVRAYSTNSTSDDSNITYVITKPVAVTWNGDAWTPSEYPDASPVVIDNTLDAVIEGDYNTTDDGTFEVKTLTVNSGSFVVAEGTSITVIDEITNNNGAENFIVENNANIIQVNEVANIGDISVQKSSSPLYRLDYTLWSSPVRGQNLQEFSSMTLANRFYDYDETTDLLQAIDPETNDFEQGLGYLIRMPNDHPAFIDADTPGTAWTGTFVGVPQNGTITVNMSTILNGYNLVGNPYPSPINIHDFYAANAATLNESSALYFWRKRNDPDATTYCNVTMAAYTANNQSGGWGDTGSGTFVGDPTTWVINPGQGFFVQASGGTLTFNNNMRANVNNNQFFRTTPEDANTLDISRLWINLTGDSSGFSQMAVAYSNVTTNDIDYGWDGKALVEDGVIKVYSTVNDNKLTIQARESFIDTDEVTLGYNVTEAGSYTISLDHTDGLFLEGQDIFLTDNLTGETVDLWDIDYMFTTEAGQFNDRFVVTYRLTPLSTPEFEINNSNVIVSTKDGAITVTAKNLEMADVNIYDVRGRLLYTKSGINTSEIVINEVQAQQQILIVNVTTDKGTVSKKVIF